MSNKPIMKVINAALDLDLANPNLAISEKESLLRDRAILLGTMDYYRYFPRRSMYITTYSTTSGSDSTIGFIWNGVLPPHQENGATYITFDELLQRSTPAAKDLDHAYFIGLGKMERAPWSLLANPSVWDMQMLGFANVGSVSPTNQDILGLLYNNTLDELSAGQPQYTVSTEEERVYLHPSFGIGQISFQTYWGYDTPEYIEVSKVDFACKFISYRFIEAIIQARDGVKFDADFQISTEALQKRLEKLKEETDSIKNHSVLDQALWA